MVKWDGKKNVLHVFYLDEDIFTIQIGNEFCILAGISVCSTTVYLQWFPLEGQCTSVLIVSRLQLLPDTKPWSFFESLAFLSFLDRTYATVKSGQASRCSASASSPRNQILFLQETCPGELVPVSLVLLCLMFSVTIYQQIQFFNVFFDEHDRDTFKPENNMQIQIDVQQHAKCWLRNSGPLQPSKSRFAKLDRNAKLMAAVEGLQSSHDKAGYLKWWFIGEKFGKSGSLSKSATPQESSIILKQIQRSRIF